MQKGGRREIGVRANSLSLSVSGMVARGRGEIQCSSCIGRGSLSNRDLITAILQLVRKEVQKNVRFGKIAKSEMLMEGGRFCSSNNGLSTVKMVALARNRLKEDYYCGSNGTNYPASSK